MKMNHAMTSAAVALTMLAVTGCTTPSKTVKAAGQAPTVSMLSGKVLETMDAGGYTYVNLEKDGKQTWVAAPVMKVTVGQDVTLLPGAEMTNFPSTALNRTFDKIIFSGGALPAAADAAAKKPAADTSKMSTEPILVGKVVETMNAVQYTYMLLEKDGKTAWAAVPYATVAIGDEIELKPGTVMGKFSSKRLNRTFDEIYFSAGIKSQKSDSKAMPAAEQPAAGEQAAPAATQLPSGHPSIDPAALAAPSAPPAAAAPLTGKVVETTDGGGYTYICLEKDGQKTWAAVPTMKVSVGQELSLYPGNVMTNFASKTLNRTFDKIVFSSGPVTN